MSYCFPDHEAFPARIRQWETAFLVMPRPPERFCDGKLSSPSRLVPRGDPVMEVCPPGQAQVPGTILQWQNVFPTIRSSLEVTDHSHGSQTSS